MPVPIGYRDLSERLYARLEKEGWLPVDQIFPVAATELDMMGFHAVVKPDGARTHVVSTVYGDGLAREQIRYLSDQFYNSLALETNQLQDAPTKIRGVCLFIFDGRPPAREAEFLMGQRAGGRFKPVNADYWVVSIAQRDVRRLKWSSSPFSTDFVVGCMAD